MKTIVLAGGCFWGVEKYFSLIKGVVATEVAYVNGFLDSVTYQELNTDRTGFAEAVWIKYDPSIISLNDLLDLYYQIIDPTTLNIQGNDRGTQYRTGIYFENEDDKKIIQESLKNLQKFYKKPILVEIESLKKYIKAEDYHQKYLDKNPHGYCHISIPEDNLSSK